jgi:hypothetical protein
MLAAAVLEVINEALKSALATLSTEKVVVANSGL